MKKIYRSTKDKVVGGVCAGLAEYFDLDPVLVRVAAVVSLISGVGLIIYAVAWIMIPPEPADRMEIV
jgi:phage shock protein PspC (stress-responsive transcriptional regulator)